MSAVERSAEEAGVDLMFPGNDAIFDQLTGLLRGRVTRRLTGGGGGECAAGGRGSRTD
ncbi:hypothetical protein [Nonomuraea rhizosphaerae]|uniref:hypothetical protein n=1 Tax=Nonomuraea rhizosphaerae TaxID=2665663 RepID=UPI001C5E2612|nr:hypothetical protein [Nonomuraea rhizosphaerae]